MAQNKPQKQALPSKEASLFRSLVKFYEQKQYKKGIKTADSILKKHPNHGETLAMKGLILNGIDGRKEEAYDYVRRGLKEDLTSHVSWHVYGLLYRSDREYNEAIKCYRNALRHDKDNIQILRDLSMLLIHLRDLDGFMETRRHLLTLKPGHRAHWTAFAMGAHLAKDYAKAISILDEYEKTMEIPEKPDFETSEFIVYKSMVIEESNNYQAALDYLQKSEKHIVDKLFYKEKKAEYLYKLGNVKESEQIYRELISINNENKEYHYNLQTVLGLSPDSKGTRTEEQKNKLKEIYEEMKGQYPKSDTVARLPLEFSEGEEFSKKFSDYVQNGIRRAVPSLFNSIKFIYKDENKVKIVHSLVENYEKELRKTNKFTENSEKIESPDALFWTLFYLAQHYDKIGESNKAIITIDKAIEHTPTVIEAYCIKGRIYKHSGDIKMASICYERAREMDLADRYLNNKSAKYLLRNNQIEKAISILGLFTKEGDDVEKYLTDMQCMWFELEAGNAHYRLGNYGKSLKKLVAIDTHFKDIVEDQFDFHTYCLRKMTMRSYIKLLRLEDEVYDHSYYRNATMEIIKTYIHLHLNPSLLVSDKDKELENMDPDQRKKLLKLQKKKELKEEENKKQSSSNSDKKKTNVNTDVDPEGITLINVNDKLITATKYVQLLEKYSLKDVNAQTLAAQLYLHRKKYLLVIRALKRGYIANPNDGLLHKTTVQFFKQIELESKTIKPTVLTIVLDYRNSIMGNKSIDEFNKSYIEKSKSLSLSDRLYAAEALFYLDNNKKQEAIQFITSTIPSTKGFTQLQECEKVLESITKVFKDEKSAMEFKDKCKGIYPFAVSFMNEQQLKTHEEQLQIAAKKPNEDSQPL